MAHTVSLKGHILRHEPLFLFWGRFFLLLIPLNLLCISHKIPHFCLISVTQFLIVLPKFLLNPSRADSLNFFIFKSLLSGVKWLHITGMQEVTRTIWSTLKWVCGFLSSRHVSFLFHRYSWILFRCSDQMFYFVLYQRKGRSMLLLHLLEVSYRLPNTTSSG